MRSKSIKGTSSLKLRFFIPIIVGGLLISGLLFWRSFNPGRCQVCDRGACKIMKFGLKTKWGISTRTCCPRCGLHYMATHPGARVSYATDFQTGQKIDAQKAFYVTGSDVNLCQHAKAIPDEIRGASAFTRYDRCMPSAIAFEKEEAARRFRARHGGAVLSWEIFQSTIKKNPSS